VLSLITIGGKMPASEFFDAIAMIGIPVSIWLIVYSILMATSAVITIPLVFFKGERWKAIRERRKSE
jgi:hypothetical protein